MADHDCCPTDVPLGKYYICAIMNYMDSMTGEAGQCEAHICGMSVHPQTIHPYGQKTKQQQRLSPLQSPVHQHCFPYTH